MNKRERYDYAPVADTDGLTIAKLQRSISLRLRGACTTAEREPEGTTLILAVIETAVRDLWDPIHWASAATYLRRNPHEHAQLVGLDGGWMRRSIIRLLRAGGQPHIADLVEHGPPFTTTRYGAEE